MGIEVRSDFDWHNTVVRCSAGPRNASKRLEITEKHTSLDKDDKQ
jgi:hypothetical protein